MTENKVQLLEKLGLKITRLRKSRGITLEKLAYEMGISKGNLSDIENGKKDARFSTLKAIADGLELSISQLFKDF